MATMAQSPQQADDPLKPAVDNMLDEYRRTREERDAATIRLARFADTIRLLIRQMSPAERSRYEAKLQELQEGHTVGSRGGEFFGKVVSLFRAGHKREWTVPDVLEALSEKGETPEQKSLYNTINYLAATGRLKRVARGRYVLAENGPAIEYETADDGTVRRSEHDS